MDKVNQKRTYDKMFSALEKFGNDLDIPSFMAWYRSRHKITQAELARRLQVTPAQVNHFERGLSVFPYKLLRKFYRDVLKKNERQHFLTCVRGHIEKLLASKNDDDFRKCIKRRHLNEYQY